MEAEQSISSLYERVEREIHKSKGEKLTFEQFQKIHKDFIQLTTLIERADLYSNNESIDEVSTGGLKYLLVPFNHAKFVDANAVSSQLQVDAPPSRRNKLRLLVLQVVESMIWKFLALVVLDMKVLSSERSGSNDDGSLKSLFKWISNYSELRQAAVSENGSKGYVKLNDLESRTYTSSGGAMARREAKINKWKLEKELSKKVALLENEEASKTLEDEVVRKVRIDQILLAVVNSVDILEGNCMEREMLSDVVSKYDQGLTDFEISGLKLQEVDESDSREAQRRDSRFDKGFTDKVESLNLNAKDGLISKEGKILRPFTIVNSDAKRKELQGRVFGTGQTLPTMTVEELVEHELQNGGMVKPKENEPEEGANDDNLAWQDKETYRLRDWDEFTDSNKKGSGNKMGNLG